MKKEKDEYIQFKINKKNLLKGIGVVVIVLAILGLSFVASKNYGSGTEAYKFTDITIDEYLELMNSEDKKVVYIARPTCSYCQLESPIIQKIGSKYNLEIYYLNTEGFFDNEKQEYTEDGIKFMSSHEKYKDGWGTPNTIIVQNGDIVDGIYQYVEEKELLDFLKTNGIINE